MSRLPICDACDKRVNEYSVLSIKIKYKDDERDFDFCGCKCAIEKLKKHFRAIKESED